MILVKLLALVKIEKFTCMCIFLWRCGVRDPREITFSRENLPTSNAYISVKSQPIWVKFWILRLMTKSNKVYDTTLNLN